MCPGQGVGDQRCLWCVLVQAYKESVLEPMLQGSDKTPALISDYKEYHTDTTVKFLVRLSEEKLAQAEAVGLHKVFKLQSSLTCNSMVTRQPERLRRRRQRSEEEADGCCAPSRCCLTTWAV